MREDVSCKLEPLVLNELHSIRYRAERKHKAFIFPKRSLDLKDIFFCLYLIVHTVGGHCRQKCFSVNIPSETLLSYLTVETKVLTSENMRDFCQTERKCFKI